MSYIKEREIKRRGKERGRCRDSKKKREVDKEGKKGYGQREDRAERHDF